MLVGIKKAVTQNATALKGLNMKLLFSALQHPKNFSG